MSAFIERYRDRFGVELICRNLGVSASAYYQRASGERSARRLEDERLLAKIRKVFVENYECYGVRRMHAALLRDGERVGRDHVARLMRGMLRQGVGFIVHLPRMVGWVRVDRAGVPWRLTSRGSPGAGGSNSRMFLSLALCEWIRPARRQALMVVG